MTRADALLLESRRTFASYIDGFFPFEWEKKTYRLVNNYVASPWTKCDVCGTSPIKYVSVIRSEDGRRLLVGQQCIDRLTNRQASAWFKKFWMKLGNFTRNRKYIDALDSILAAHSKGELEFQIAEREIGKLQRALERMSRGLNPTREQEQLAKRYAERIGFRLKDECPHL